MLREGVSSRTGPIHNLKLCWPDLGSRAPPQSELNVIFFPFVESTTATEYLTISFQIIDFTLQQLIMVRNLLEPSILAFVVKMSLRTSENRRG